MLAFREIDHGRHSSRHRDRRQCRALTNLIGNGVACVVISLSEGELDKDALHETMAHPLELGEALEPGGGG